MASWAWKGQVDEQDQNDLREESGVWTYTDDEENQSVSMITKHKRGERRP